MTWLWVKRRPRTVFFILTFILISLLNGTTAEETPPKPTTVPPQEEGAGEGGSGGAGEGGGEEITTLPSQYTKYDDLTTFVNGVSWDFMGSWTKLDLERLTEDERPLPLIPEGKDQIVFMCQTSKIIPCVLTKRFPPLHNATFSINYFAMSNEGKMDMTVEVKRPNNSATFFNYTQPDTEKHPEGEWGTDTRQMPSLASEGDFEMVVRVKHGEEGVWAVSEISLEGLTGPPVTTTPAPPVVVTPSSNVTNVTTVAPGQNVTVTTPPPKGNSTPVAPPVTEGGDEDTDMSRLESVAKAVWDAFYVFLALFCACLLALVALIIHGRCKYVGSYPLHRESA